MKIKAVRENQNYTEQCYLTFGKDYEVLNDKDGAFIICDDDGDPIFTRLTGSCHGFDFEVVQEEPEQGVPKFKVGDKVVCLKSVIVCGAFVNEVGVVVRVVLKDACEPIYEVDFGGCIQTCYEVLDDMVLAEACPDPMPVVETYDDLECDRIEDNLNWLDGLIRGSPEQPTDNVNNPSHYGNGQIECIDYLEDFMTTEEFIGYLRGNIGKYLHRWRYKNGLEDLRKAEWYLKKLIEVYNG